MNTPGDLDVGRVLGEGAEELGQPVGADAEPPHARVDLHVHARATADARGRAGRGVDALVVVDGGLDALGDSASWLPGSPRPTINTGTLNVGDVERLGRRRDAEPRRAARRSRPRPRGGARARSRSTSPWPSPARRCRRARRAPTVLARIADTSTSTRLRGVNALELGKRREPVRTASARPTGRAGCRRRARRTVSASTPGGGGEHLGGEVVGVDDRDVDLAARCARRSPLAIRRTSPSQSVGALHAHVSYGGRLADDGPSIAFTRPPATR